jgi:hypothetical protein
MVLTIGEFFVSDGTEAWDNCVGGFGDVLHSFGNWDRDAANVSDKGLWHLFDDCYGTDGSTAGIAVIGTSCENNAGTVAGRSVQNRNVGVTSYGDQFDDRGAPAAIFTCVAILAALLYCLKVRF